MLREEPLSDETHAALAALRTQTTQAGLIAPTGPWLEEARAARDAVTYGLFQGATAVGLYSLSDPRLWPPDDPDSQPGCAFLWRFLIDGRQQGRGFGRAGLRLVEARAAGMGFVGLSLTTKDRTPGNAAPFYSACGYRPTGRRIAGEIELIRRFG